MAVCLFCQQDRTLTAEHVLPRWLNNLLPRGTNFICQLEDEALDKYVEFGGKGFNLTVRIACASCNNGWMSALESRVRPLLTSLIQGESHELHQDDLAELALWAVKTAIVSSQTGRQKVAVAAEHCQWLHEHQAPPSHTVVWLGSYTGGSTRPQHWKLHTRRLVLQQNEQPGMSLVAYDWTAGLGGLLLKVTLLPPVLWQNSMIIDLKQEAPLSQIWPSGTESITFPLSDAFSVDDLPALSMGLVGSRIEVLGDLNLSEATAGDVGTETTDAPM